MEIFTSDKMDFWHRALVLKQYFDAFKADANYKNMAIVYYQLNLIKGKIIHNYHRLLHKIEHKYEKIKRLRKKKVDVDISLDKYYVYVSKYDDILCRVRKILSECADEIKLLANTPNTLIGGGRGIEKYPTLYYFYTRTCPEAAKFNDVWKTLRQSLASKRINLTKIDCSSGSAECLKHKIDKVPTLQLLVGGNVFEYSGPRNEDSISTFVYGLVSNLK